MRLTPLIALTCTAVIVATAGTVAGTISSKQSAVPVSSQAISGGLVDVGFSQHMAWHHDQAVVMAEIIRGKASPHINLLADSVASNQLMEIGQLRGWLKIWGAPLMPVSTAMDWIFKNPRAKWDISPAYLELCQSSPGGMPGLATIDELNQLRSLTGKDLDILFLQLMLRHHMSALPMLRYTTQNAETEVVRSSAAHMLYEQRKEVRMMRSRLAQLGQHPLPFPDLDIQ